MAKRKRKKPLTATKKSSKTGVNRRLPSLQKKTKRPRILRDSRGRFISAKKEKKNVQRRKTKSGPRKRRILPRVSKRKKPPIRESDQRKRAKTPRRPARAKKRVDKRRRAKPRKLPTGIRFLEGQEVRGRDPDFKRAVMLKDEHVKITTNVAKSPRALNNVRLGIDGKVFEIEKRTIEFARPKSFSGTTEADDWGQDSAIESKVKEFFDSLGPGIYYCKIGLTYPNEDGDITTRWVSHPRKQVDDADDILALLFSLLTTLQIARNTNVYGLKESGYGFRTIEIERIDPLRPNSSL